MDAITLRLEPETIEELDAEYEERGFRNRTLYLRRLIEQRDVIFDEEGAEIDATERLTDHDEQLSEHDARLEDLDERVEDLEDHPQPLGRSRSS
jgi:hypothetical protein